MQRVLTGWMAATVFAMLYQIGIADEPQRPPRPFAGTFFQRLDANHDGQLAADELPQQAPDHLKELIKGADRNGDKIVSREEFTAAIEHHRPGPPEGRPAGSPGGRVGGPPPPFGPPHGPHGPRGPQPPHTQIQGPDRHRPTATSARPSPHPRPVTTRSAQTSHTDHASHPLENPHRPAASTRSPQRPQPPERSRSAQRSPSPQRNRSPERTTWAERTRSTSARPGPPSGFRRPPGPDPKGSKGHHGQGSHHQPFGPHGRRGSFAHGMPSPEAVFARLDRNEDKKLSLKEFTEGMKRVHQAVGQRFAMAHSGFGGHGFGGYGFGGHGFEHYGFGDSTFHGPGFRPSMTGRRGFRPPWMGRPAPGGPMGPEAHRAHISGEHHRRAAVAKTQGEFAE